MVTGNSSGIFLNIRVEFLKAFVCFKNSQIFTIYFPIFFKAFPKNYKNVHYLDRSFLWNHKHPVSTELTRENVNSWCLTLKNRMTWRKKSWKFMYYKIIYVLNVNIFKLQVLFPFLPWFFVLQNSPRHTIFIISHMIRRRKKNLTSMIAKSKREFFFRHGR